MGRHLPMVLSFYKKKILPTLLAGRSLVADLASPSISSPPPSAPMSTRSRQPPALSVAANVFSPTPKEHKPAQVKGKKDVRTIYRVDEDNRVAYLLDVDGKKSKRGVPFDKLSVLHMDPKDVIKPGAVDQEGLIVRHKNPEYIGRLAVMKTVNAEMCHVELSDGGGRVSVRRDALHVVDGCGEQSTAQKVTKVRLEDIVDTFDQFRDNGVILAAAYEGIHVFKVVSRPPFWLRLNSTRSELQNLKLALDPNGKGQIRY
jgi:hypothetical protein